MRPIQQKTLTSGTEQSRITVFGKTLLYKWNIPMKTPYPSRKENRRDGVECQR